MHGLHAPTPLHEFDRQPVEQLRMRGASALRAEILGRLDDAASEKLLPEAIHGGARGERIVLANQPACEAEPVRHLALRQRRQRRGRVRIYQVTLAEEGAADA